MLMICQIGHLPPGGTGHRTSEVAFTWSQPHRGKYTTTTTTVLLFIFATLEGASLLAFVLYPGLGLFILG